MVSESSSIPVLKARIVRGREYFLDQLDSLIGRRDWSTPPRSLQFIGGGDFARTGESYLNFFIDVCGLSPDDSVLDVGCGVGRMAIPLTRFLSTKGQYRGFDVVKPGIDWCRERITSRYPNFQFEAIDIYNKTYNPTGKLTASIFDFPYQDQQFDLIFLTSVFTHMLPRDLEHYLNEIVRVLKPGKLCLITYFLLNKESCQLTSSGCSQMNFKYDAGGCLTINQTVPESAVAYDEAYINDLYIRAGLTVVKPIRYGTWSGRNSQIRFQDLVLASRK